MLTKLTPELMYEFVIGRKLNGSDRGGSVANRRPFLSNVIEFFRIFSEQTIRRRRRNNRTVMKAAMAANRQ